MFPGCCPNHPSEDVASFLRKSALNPHVPYLNPISILFLLLQKRESFRQEETPSELPEHVPDHQFWQQLRLPAAKFAHFRHAGPGLDRADRSIDHVQPEALQFNLLNCLCSCYSGLTPLQSREVASASPFRSSLFQ
jgi:hypothetical protein